MASNPQIISDLRVIQEANHSLELLTVYKGVPFICKANIKTVEEIADRAGISRYGALVLLEAGLSLEMIMVKDDKYFITKTGYFMIADQLTRVNTDFTNDVNYKAFFHLQDSIKETIHHGTTQKSCGHCAGASPL